MNDVNNNNTTDTKQAKFTIVGLDINLIDVIIRALQGYLLYENRNLKSEDVYESLFDTIGLMLSNLQWRDPDGGIIDITNPENWTDEAKADLRFQIEDNA